MNALSLSTAQQVLHRLDQLEARIDTALAQQQTRRHAQTPLTQVWQALTEAWRDLEAETRWEKQRAAIKLATDQIDLAIAELASDDAQTVGLRTDRPQRPAGGHVTEAHPSPRKEGVGRALVQILGEDTKNYGTAP